MKTLKRLFCRHIWVTYIHNDFTLAHFNNGFTECWEECTKCKKQITIL